MKYNIYINQAALHKTKLNLVDCALLDYLYFFCNSLNQKIEKQRITDKNGQKWTWIDYGKVVADMPLLGIKNKSALTRHFINLTEEGYIKTTFWKEKKKYVCLLPKTDDLFVNNESEMTEVISRNDVRHPIISVVNNIPIVDNVTNDTNVTIPTNVTVVCSKLTPCGHCSKCSLTACTDIQLWEIAMRLNISPEDVKRKHSAIMELIESGTFQTKYKKDKTVYYTLQNWLRMSVDRGQTHLLDETQRLYWQAQHPDKLKELKVIEDYLRKKGQL